jgi:hypothetical protein
MSYLKVFQFQKVGLLKLNESKQGSLNLTYLILWVLTNLWQRAVGQWKEVTAGEIFLHFGLFLIIF